MVDISVIMAVCNGEINLCRTIDSILKQTFKNFEFIIVTDISTTIIDSYSYIDTRIRTLKNLTHEGVYSSLNKGLNISEGKYICFIDTNSISYPERFQIQYEYMETHNEVIAIGTDFDYLGVEEKRDLPKSHVQLMISLLNNNNCLHSSMMIRSDIVKMLGGYDEKYTICADYELITRLALRGGVENIPKVLMGYYPHDHHVSQMLNDKRRKLMNEVRRNYQIAFVNKFSNKVFDFLDEFCFNNYQLGKIIALYTYSKNTGESIYERLAGQLLDKLLDQRSSSDQENGLGGLGCGLIYLLRNGFVDGAEDEVLSDLDSLSIRFSHTWSSDNIYNLFTWIYYSTLRIESDDSCVLEPNKITLIQFLDRLIELDKPLDDFSDVLKKIDTLKIFPERIKCLMNRDFKSRKTVSLDKIHDRGVTFIIPFRIDSFDRKRNLDIILSHLSKRECTKILLLEADSISKYKVSSNFNNVEYCFVKDDNPIFYRTKYLNILLRKTETTVVGIWDTDVIISENQINQAIWDIIENKFIISFPYDGNFYFLSQIDSIIFRHNPSMEYLKNKKTDQDLVIPHSFGGAFFVNKNIYLEAGGENEHFYGWGMEDRERVKRIEILGYSISRVKGPLYHLYHKRYENSRFYNRTLQSQSEHEFIKICSFTRVELEKYIQSWKNIAEKYENKLYVSLNINNMKIPIEATPESPFWSNYFCLIEKYNIAFIAISKNASTELKKILLYSIYGFYPENEDDVYDLIGDNEESPYLCPVYKMKEREALKGKMIKFAVWRDPVERLVSCYKFFCLERENRVYFRYLSLYEDNSFERFMEFVRFELKKSNPLYQDEHIRKQSDYYSIEDVDYIIPIKQLNNFLDRYNIPIAENYANKTTIDFVLNDESYINEIKDLYQADYDLYNSYLLSK